MTRYKRLYLISALILVVGLGSSVAIYVSAGSGPEEGDQYEIVGNKIYPGGQERSKAYRHNLEVFGGKAAVLADDFNRWFEGLWQGRTLAFTVGLMFLVTSLGFFLAARHFHISESDGNPQEDDKA